MNEPGRDRSKTLGWALLMPVAVVVAGGMIGAAIYFGMRENALDSRGGSVVASPPASSLPAAAPTASPSVGAANSVAPVASFSTILVGYAGEIGLDEGIFKSCVEDGVHREAVLADVRQAREIGATGTPTFFINGKRLVGAHSFEVFKEIIDRELDATPPTQPSDYSPEVQRLGTSGSFNPTPVSLEVGNAPSKGAGPVTLMEFTDYQCPFCLRHFTNTIPALEREFEGKLTYVIKDLPLTNIHNKALEAAEAARCAGDQGEFWKMHDLLFNRQGQWTRSG